MPQPHPIRTIRANRIPALITAALFVVATPAGAQFSPGPEYLNQPALATINVLPAYNAGLSGLGVRVGVVDSGMNPAHLEFSGALIAAYDAMTGKSGTSNFSSFLVDYEGHGSHVASIAVARLDGAARPYNMQGVAYNASLVMSAMSFVPELTEQKIAAAIDYASSHGVKVINNSWGSDSAGTGDPQAHYQNNLASSGAIVAAIHTALDRGSVIVFAAGNESTPHHDPTYVAINPSFESTFPAYDAVMAAKGGFITVVATTNDGSALSYFSNRCGVSKHYCIAAPGGNQYFANDPGGILGADANTNDGYVYWQGTSMASPVVSGAVALVAEQFPWMTNKNLTTTILTTGSRAAAPDAEWGRGLLNVGKAIQGPGIFEEDFSADVPVGYSSTFSNDISGTAGLIKRGAGSLILSGNNTYSGETFFYGGELVASSQANLGSSSNPLQFDGGTLKFGADFTLGRALVIGPGHGTLNLNGYNKTQTSNISGTGQFGLTGGGSYTLDRANPQQGGIAVRGGSMVNAQRDEYLGATGSKVTLDNGRLNLLTGFVPASAGIFNRPIEIGAGNGTLDTGDSVLAYTGGEIGGGGKLSFVGSPLTMGSDLSLNGIWDANLVIPAGLILKGNGGVNGNLTVAGILAPGNSPGVLTVAGSVTHAAGSTFNVEIDGVGTGTGAGSHDRLVLTGASSTYTAGGSLNPILRGISGAASNTYQPALGQGFQFVTAPGGVIGSFSSFTQPGSGLLPGTRLDLVYGTTGLALYATPASYANIAAAGVTSNSNRQQVGAILERLRPAPGARESDPGIKRLFDSLAPQSARTLPISIDQLGGVGYAQLVGMNLENSKFLVNQTLLAVARQRRGEPREEVWGQAIGRVTTWRGDNFGYRMNDVLGGLMGGFQKRLDARTLAGVSVAYAESRPRLDQGMGSGPQQSLQLMGYASRSFDDGYYLQGAAGGGAGRIDATRPVAMLGSQNQAKIDTLNVAASIATGWATVANEALRYETSFGLNYLSMRSHRFADSGNQPLGALRVEPRMHTSLAAALGGSVSMPFAAHGIDWRATALASVTHEFAARRTTLDARLFGQSIEVQSAAIGRDRLTLGVSLTGQVDRLTHIAFEISNESAHHWNATSLGVSVKRAF